jgi:hypothetical protein
VDLPKLQKSKASFPYHCIVFYFPFFYSIFYQPYGLKFIINFDSYLYLSEFEIGAQYEKKHTEKLFHSEKKT